MWIGIARCALKYTPPVSASATEPTTFRIVLHSTLTAPFIVGVGIAGGCPNALLFDTFENKYYEL